MSEVQPLDLQTRPAFRAAVGVLSGATLLSGLAFIALSLLSSPPVWFMLGFEIVITVAAVFGLLTALGRFREGPAMALLCVAGAVGVGSLLAYIGAGRSIMGWSLKPYLLARLADAALLAAAAGLLVLARDPRRSARSLIGGVVFGVALVALLGGLWFGRGALAGAPGIVRTGVLLLGGAVGVALLAASVHLTVKAFQHGATLPRGSA